MCTCVMKLNPLKLRLIYMNNTVGRCLNDTDYARFSFKNIIYVPKQNGNVSNDDTCIRHQLDANFCLLLVVNTFFSSRS